MSHLPLLLPQASPRIHIRKNLINLYYNTYYKKNKDYLKKLCNSFLIIMYYCGIAGLILHIEIAIVIKR